MTDGSAAASAQWTGLVREVLGAAAAILGLVYVAGGIVIGARLFAADLPAYYVVGLMPRDFLLSVGVSGVVLPTATLTLPYVMFRALRGPKVKPSRFRNFGDPGGWESLKMGLLTLCGSVALGAWAVVRILQHPDLSDWLIVVPVVVAPAWTFIALHFRERVSRRPRKPSEPQGGTHASDFVTIDAERYNAPRRVVAMVVIFAGWLAGGVVMTQAAFPFPRAVVCTAADAYPGRLVGSSDADVFLGDTRRIRAIPRDRVEEVEVTARASECPAPASG